MPLTGCDEDKNPVNETIYGTITGTVGAEGTGIAGATINVVGANSYSATTGAGGTYTITNVEAGSYGVALIVPQDVDAVFATTNQLTTISQTGEVVTVDFNGSFIRTASITGIVSASGAPLAGVAVAVTGGADNVTKNAVTNGGGEYSVTGLRAGNYTVTITQPAGGVTFSTLTAQVTVSSGENQTAHFAGQAVQMASISGAVTLDGVAAVGVTVTLSGGADATTETGANGAYAFTNLTPGTYTVTVTPPDGATFEPAFKTLTLGEGQTGVASFAGRGELEPATISIKSITRHNGSGNVIPVDLTNVFGQIEVTVNIERNGQTPNYVDVLIGDEVVATQRFAVPAAPAEMAGQIEELTLNVPTTQVERGVGDMAWVPVVFNGGRELSAQLYVAEEPAKPIPTNKVPVVMQNEDRLIPGDSVGGNLMFAADSMAVTGWYYENGATLGGLNDWYKGPSTFTGPQYLSYSMDKPTSVKFTTQPTVCTAASTVTGSYDAGITLSNAFACAATEGLVWPNHNSFTVVSSSPLGPDGTAVMVSDTMASLGAQFMLSDPTNEIGPRRYVIGQPISVQILPADSLLIDNLGPTVTLNTVAFNRLWDEQWINADYDLIEGMVVSSASSDTDDVIVLTDGGVGRDNASRMALEAIDSTLVSSHYIYNCGTEAITNADLDPTVTDTTFDGHRICAYGEDLLDNPGQIQHPNGYSTYLFSNWFGKDIVAPTIDMAMSTRGGFVAFTTPPITANDSVGLDSPDNLFNIASPYDDGLGNPRGWGIDAYDNSAGFHQNNTGTGVGPAVQTVYRYYPDPTSALTLVDTIPASTWLGVQLAVPGETWNRSSDLGYGDALGPAVESLVDPTAVGTLFGLYLWDVKVTDQAGNASTLKRNFAIDQVSGPHLSQITLGQLQYTPGQFGLFNIWGSDDFEVDTVQMAMDYPLAVGGTFTFWYPPTKADPTISPWDMDYPYDVVGPFAYSAGINGANPIGILGRLDGTMADGTLDPDTLNYNVDGADADVTATDDDMLPTQVWGNILTDILGNPTLDAPVGPVGMVGFDFGGWSSATAQPWTDRLPDFIHFRLIDKTLAAPGYGAAFGGDFTELRAEHKVSNSIIAPWFDRVYLVHLDPAANVRICGEMSVVVQTDEGVDRFFRYNLPTTTTIPAYCEAAGSLHAVGIKGAAGLVTNIAVSLTIAP